MDYCSGVRHVVVVVCFVLYLFGFVFVVVLQFEEGQANYSKRYLVDF